MGMAMMASRMIHNVPAMVRAYFSPIFTFFSLFKSKEREVIHNRILGTNNSDLNKREVYEFIRRLGSEQSLMRNEIWRLHNASEGLESQVSNLVKEVDRLRSEKNASILYPHHAEPAEKREIEEMLSEMETVEKLEVG